MKVIWQLIDGGGSNAGSIETLGIGSMSCKAGMVKGRAGARIEVCEVFPAASRSAFSETSDPAATDQKSSYGEGGAS